MKALFDPFLMMFFCVRQIRIGNANIGKAQLTAPAFDVIGEARQIVSNGSAGSHE